MTPYIMVIISHSISHIFTVICFIGVILTAIGVPETKGKTLDEIEAAFGIRDGNETDDNIPPVVHDYAVMPDVN